MNSPTNSIGSPAVPFWQQVLFCSVGCASLALAAGYMLGKGSTKAPTIGDPPQLTPMRARVVPMPIPIDRLQNHMPPAHEDDLGQTATDATTRNRS